MGMLDPPLPNVVLPPKVSVVIPAYNVAEYIGEALDSVFAQSFTDFEVMVVNDGSPDTPELERAIAPYQERIVYLKQENKGAAAARNTGLRRAVGEYVAFLDSDDVWAPNYLREQLAFLEGRKLDFVYCDAKLIGDHPFAGRTYMETTPSTGAVTPESLLALRCNVITSGVLVRRRLVVEVGMFDEGIRRAHDFDLWLRLAKNGAKIDYQKTVLLTHRMLASGLSGDSVSQEERAITVLSKIEQRISLTETEKQTLSKTLKGIEAALSLEKGKAYLRERNFAEAGRAIELANRYYRSWKLRIILIGLRLAPSVVLGFYPRREKP